MSRVDTMESLTGELTRSFERRRTEHLARRRDVRESLVSRRVAQRAVTADLHQRLAAEGVSRRSTMLHTLANDHHRRAAIAISERAARAEENTRRQSEVNSLRARAGSSVEQSHAARIANQAAQAAALHAFRADLTHAVTRSLAATHQARRSGARTQREGLQDSNAVRRASITHVLAETSTTRLAARRTQRLSLSEDRASRYQQVVASLEQSTATRQVLGKSLSQASQTWNTFARTMGVMRSGAFVAPPEAAVEPAAAAAPAVSPGAIAIAPTEITLPAAPMSVANSPPAPKASVAVVAPPAVEAQRQPSDDDVFSYLADHPDGVRLVELEEHFAIPRIRLALMVNRLIEGNRARKDDDHKVYFAT